ncbi:hypothetical protein PoB_005854500 [Plakobranchus ocellatus]|uniref:Endonuclease/exonuclease/phosphatase domain-containing protein n=1 Tax=Plakobranchus ocellatus TaxID=259542 RepID=A0AAV4CKA9_9GAST|nr:hypothetical protein PoB_005854500 [Plakobranchus ocellatus]
MKQLLGILIHLPDKKLTTHNCYAPPATELRLHSIKILQEDCIIVGDFNGHSPNKYCEDLDTKKKKKKEVEDCNHQQLPTVIDKDDVPHSAQELGRQPLPEI